MKKLVALLLLAGLCAGCAAPIVNVGGTVNIVVVVKCIDGEGMMQSTTAADQENPLHLTVPVELP